MASDLVCIGDILQIHILFTSLKILQSKIGCSNLMDTFDKNKLKMYQQDFQFTNYVSFSCKQVMFRQNI